MNAKWMKWGSALAVGLIAAVAPAKTTARGVVCRAELDRGVLPARQSGKAVVKITLEAPSPAREERPPVNLCLVLDRSGSMSGDKIKRAKEAAIEAVRRLGPDDIVSLVIYDHEVETLVPAQSASNSEWIESQIESIRSRGNTALYGGVSQGASEVRKNADRRHVSRIILLSDGLANVGPSSPAELGRLGTSLMKEGISVTTIGVGTDYNEDLMTTLAENSDGNTYFVENSADLPRIFAAELGDVLSVVARDVQLEIECPEGVRPLRIIGRDGVIRGRKVELRLNQLYGGQHKFALVEVEVPATDSDRTLQIAMARVDYDDAITATRAQAESSVEARFSDEEKRVEASANLPVQKDVLFNEAAEARDQAIELSDKGERQQAAQLLKSNADKLKVWAERNQAPEMLAPAAAFNKEAEVVSEEGYDSRSRKAAKTSSANIRSQQKSP